MRVGWLAILHWQAFDITSLECFTINTKQKGDTRGSLKHCQRARFPRQQHPGYPAYCGGGGPGIPANDEFSSAPDQVGPPKYVFFQ
jgi:hypothetical protein